MSNELLWFILIITDFTLTLSAIYFFGKRALFVIITANILVCNLQVIKTVEIFGFVATLGNALYGGIFLATDLLSESFGKKEAKKGVWLGFFALVFMTLTMQIALKFQPHESDFSQEALQTIFGFMPRIAFASIIAYLVSQHHDVWAFHYWRTKTKGKFLWLRNNASTFVSQAIDSLLFVLLAFWGVFEVSVLLSILFTTYFFKIVIAVFDTPIMYAGRWILNKHLEKFGKTEPPEEVLA